MKFIISAIVSWLIFGNNFTLHAQKYSKAQQLSIFPSEVLIENYNIVLLPEDKTATQPMNRFDPVNPYTFIQVINEKNGKEFHILYQTDFFGKLLLLAYSNSLAAVFNNKDKPFIALQICIRNLNHSVFTVQNTGAAINCIIDRLNYCSE